MSLYIFTTEHDLSRFSLEKAANKVFTSCQLIYYDKLSFVDGNWVFAGKKFTIRNEDKMLFRWPWDAENMKKDYSGILQMLIMSFENKSFLDKRCLQQYAPFYEDKLFQYYLFSALQIPTPKTYFAQSAADLSDSMQIPVVAKKRVSSRSKGNFLLKDQLSLENFKQESGQYIFQEFINIVDDVRILMIQGEVIGAVKRNTHIRTGNRLAVKGMSPYTVTNQHVIDDCRQIQEYLGADFLGFDVLFDDQGKYYIIEANLSPQYTSFEQVTKLPVSEMVLERLAV
jgi:hypothetical protein